MSHQIVFFGSFQKYSVQVLDKLHNSANFQVTTVITTPPAPKGRHLELVKNESQIYSEKNNIPCFQLESLSEIPSGIFHNPPDFLVVAGYGKLIPPSWLKLPRTIPVNLHQSLLPNYPGRCPAEWAILNGETQTGVTLIKMSEKFDQGDIITQRPLDLTDTDTRLTLYTKLYNLGAELLITTLPQITSNQITPLPQEPGQYFYARQITREDGFIPWDQFVFQIQSRSPILDRKHRALAGWPGVWTTNPRNIRVKLISLTPQVLIQEAGKTPIPWQP